MKIVQEFKAFVMRGNVVDLAIGVIIGAAFSSIVNSLVKDVLMPVFGALTSSVDVKDLVWKITPPIGNGQPVVISYGIFINNIISFLIVAFCIFLLVKGMNALVKKEEAAAPPSDEVKLLTEIRDLLKNKST